MSRRLILSLGMLALSAGSSFADSPPAVVEPAVVTELPAGLPPDTGLADAPALIEYGASLFRSPLLSAGHALSCAGCHLAQFGFSGEQPYVNGAAGKRHVPAIVNLYAATSLMWDGRADSLIHQVRIPLESPSEMAIDWPAALSAVAELPATARFAAATGTKVDRPVILAALAAYARSLVSGGSPFDRYYYAGDESAISEQAKEGLRVFTRKARCSTCHLLTGNSAPLTDGNFHSIGIGWQNGTYADDGRADVTGNPADRGLFKMPSLRNVALRPYLMHDGSMVSLRQVIAYYNVGCNPEAANLDPRLAPLMLTEQDIENLTVFLQTLSAPVESYRPGAAITP